MHNKANGNRGICETVKIGLVMDGLGLDEFYPLLKDHYIQYNFNHLA